MAHQAGADHVVLHPVAAAADVEVDLVIALRLRQARAGRQIGRVAAAQLQGQRVFAIEVAQKTLGIAMQQGAGGDHLGVEQGAAGQLAQEEAAVAVGPVHHRCNGKSARELFA